MAGSGKRGGPDRVLESRHLVGIFLGVVLLCSVFFTLGYVMGRQQYGGSVHAAEAVGKLISSSPSPAPVKPKAAEPPVAPANSEWDFYSKKDSPAAEPDAKTAAPTPAVATRKTGAPAPAMTTPVAASTKPSAHLQSPKMVKGAIVVQVAALTRENDALAMADTIQQKKFPAFVVTPAGDNYYRVQVGPYSDEKSADAAKHALEQLGFKPIIKR